MSLLGALAQPVVMPGNLSSTDQMGYRANGLRRLNRAHNTASLVTWVLVLYRCGAIGQFLEIEIGCSTAKPDTCAATAA